MEQPKITIAICTYNRADCLEGSVSSSFDQDTQRPYEVLIVDNNSTDNTQQVLAGLKQRYPDLRCVTELIQGLSSARNRALRESKAEIVAFIDDDCVLSKGWGEAIWRGFDDPAVAAVGGITHLKYPEDNRPDWIVASMEGLLGLNDHGPNSMETEEVHGNNMAVRRLTAIELGGFDAGFGYQGSKNPVAGEDVEFCQRVRAAGYKVMYVPEAMLIHIVHPGRLRLEWFFRRARENGYYVGITKGHSISLWQTMKCYMKCRLLTLSLGVVGNRRQSLFYAMQMQLTAGELDVMLPGIGGWFYRIALALAALPYALIRLAASPILDRTTKRQNRSAPH